MWHFALLLSQCNTLVLSVFLYIASQTEDSHGNISAHRSALRVRQKTAMVSLHPVTLHCESDRRQLWYHFTPSLYPASQTVDSYGITSPRRSTLRVRQSTAMVSLHPVGSTLRVRQKTAMVSLHPVALPCESDRAQLWYHFTPSHKNTGCRKSEKRDFFAPYWPAK